MAHQVLWNTIVLEEFSKLAGLSELEYEIMKTRMQGMTRVEQSLKFQISLASVDRIISRLKVKYDSVQKHSDVLPPRRFSAKETYMDSH